MLMWYVGYHCCTNSLNSVLVNTAPLSDTKSSGIPCVANMERRAVIVAEDVAFLTILMSIHFE